MARRASRRKSPPNEIQAHVGGVLKDYREGKKITQKDLAKRSATTEERVIAYEKGRRWPSSVTLDRLLKALDYPEVEFFHTLAEALRPAPPDTATDSDAYRTIPTGSEIRDRDLTASDDMVELEFEKFRMRIPADRLSVARKPASRPSPGRNPK